MKRREKERDGDTQRGRQRQRERREERAERRERNCYLYESFVSVYSVPVSKLFHCK